MRFGHPRLFVFLRRDFTEVNHKRSRRIYPSLGLQIRRRKRKKLGSYPRLPPTRATELLVDHGTGFKSRAMLDLAYKNEMRLEVTKVRKPNQVINSFNSQVHVESLNEHVLFALDDSSSKIDRWHWNYSNFNPHSICVGQKWITAS